MPTTEKRGETDVVSIMWPASPITHFTNLAELTRNSPDCILHTFPFSVMLSNVHRYVEQIIAGGMSLHYTRGSFDDFLIVKLAYIDRIFWLACRLNEKNPTGSSIHIDGPNGGLSPVRLLHSDSCQKTQAAALWPLSGRRGLTRPPKKQLSSTNQYKKTHNTNNHPMLYIVT